MSSQQELSSIGDFGLLLNREIQQYNTQEKLWMVESVGPVTLENDKESKIPRQLDIITTHYYQNGNKIPKILDKLLVEFVDRVLFKDSIGLYVHKDLFLDYGPVFCLVAYMDSFPDDYGFCEPYGYEFILKWRMENMSANFFKSLKMSLYSTVNLEKACKHFLPKILPIDEYYADRMPDNDKVGNSRYIPNSIIKIKDDDGFSKRKVLLRKSSAF